MRWHGHWRCREYPFVADEEQGRRIMTRRWPEDLKMMPWAVVEAKRFGKGFIVRHLFSRHHHFYLPPSLLSSYPCSSIPCHGLEKNICARPCATGDHTENSELVEQQQPDSVSLLFGLWRSMNAKDRKISWTFYKYDLKLQWWVSTKNGLGIFT